jgi:flagellin
MGLSIATNMTSVVAQKNLRANSRNLENTVARLSSGLRINKAADDAAGLAISEGLRSQVRGLSAALRNASDGISLIQTAEGVLGTVHGILTRMRELAIQSANGTYGTAERGYMQNQFREFLEEIDRIASVVEFSGINLLDGTLRTGISFQVGLHSTLDNRITVSIPDAHTSVIGLNNGMFLFSQSISSINGALMALGSIDAAIRDTSSIRGGLGAVQNRLEQTIDNIEIMRQNFGAAESQIRDADIAAESSELTRINILTQVATSMVAQANQIPYLALQLLQ